MFSLQLMAVGAPAELIRRAHLAAIDEVKHAQISFTLASLLHPNDLHSSPRPFDRPLDLTISNDFLSMCIATAREGAVDEMMSTFITAIELDSINQYEIPEISELLKVIIEDESRHAFLAWETLAWCVQTSNSSFNMQQVLNDSIIELFEERIRSFGVKSDVEERIRNFFSELIRLHLSSSGSASDSSCSESCGDLHFDSKESDRSVFNLNEAFSMIRRGNERWIAVESK